MENKRFNRKYMLFYLENIWETFQKLYVAQNCHSLHKGFYLQLI